MWDCERLLNVISLRLSDKDLEHCKSKGDVSKYVRWLIRNDRKQSKEEDRIDKLVRQLVGKYQFMPAQKTDNNITEKAKKQIGLLFGDCDG